MRWSRGMSDSLLALLRRSTAQAHTEIERKMDIEAAISAQSAYALLIQRLLGFYEPLEANLSARSDGYCPAGREKIPWLRSDLKALGLTDEEIAAIPRCNNLPAIDSAAAAFGCAYVVEGATLGGRQISAMLQKSAVPPEARAFFAGYGAETGARWREFCETLEAFGASNGSDAADDAVRAALETFASMEDWICRSPVAA